MMTDQMKSPEKEEFRVAKEQVKNTSEKPKKSDTLILDALREKLKKRRREFVNYFFDKFGLNATDVVYNSELSIPTSERIAIGENVVVTSLIQFYEGLFDRIGRCFDIKGLIESITSVSSTSENLYTVKATAQEAALHPEWKELFVLKIRLSDLLKLIEHGKKIKKEKEERKKKKMRAQCIKRNLK